MIISTKPINDILHCSIMSLDLAFVLGQKSLLHSQLPCAPSLLARPVLRQPVRTEITPAQPSRAALSTLVTSSAARAAHRAGAT